MNSCQPVILLIEDNEDDIFFMERALRKAKISLPIQVARDGQEAMNYLSGVGKFADRVAYPMPSVVFLDLKLPYLHGFELLSRMQEHAGLRDIRVIVLTSSPELRDRQKAKELGAKA